MESERLLEMSVELVKAHLTNGTMAAEKIPALIQSVFSTLQELSGDASREAFEGGVSTPAGNGAPPILRDNVEGKAFDGLDPWLASRLSPRIAEKLNRGKTVHPSVYDDYLICLEDGARVKLLRSYIRKRFGMSLQDYADRWQLPDDYPVAPPAYLSAKRATAKAMGFGSVTRGKRGKAKGPVVRKQKEPTVA